MPDYDGIMVDERERLLSLEEIIQMTGHRNRAAAYNMLRRYGKKPDGRRRASRRPHALWRESVVREVFARHIEDVERIRRNVSSL